ncbi:hypothetical protein [Streptomyces sp. NPDC096324]|uniref:hypothetical protein n=1 Tax=Streptomyces sp. NPDC096324 TaxID=3366085 RepID=UPI00381E1237
MTTALPVRLRVARLVTEASAPTVSLLVVMAFVGWNATPDTSSGVMWGVLAAGIAAAGPQAYILHGIRWGRISDRHVRLRRQRRGPLVAGLASVATSCFLLAATHAPRALLALLIASFVGLIVSLLVTHWWKVSLHTAVAGGAIAILVLVFGARALTAIVALPLIGWSRVALGDHTLAQVVGGTGIGGLTAVTVFALLR